VVPFLHYTPNDNGGPRPGSVNGTPCLVNTSGDPAFQKPYIINLTQLLGTGPNAHDGQAPLPATMTVDYVRVWQ
jgi:hypothetical protein